MAVRQQAVLAVELPLMDNVADVAFSTTDSSGSSAAAGQGASAPRFDAVVVGAGPAGSLAALQLARAGHSVALLERGPFPGSKNMFGGVVYGRVLDDIIPKWWESVPVQRWVTRRQTMMMTPTQAFTIDYRSDAWGTAPFNGATVYRPDFDSWLASFAVDAGAQLICETTATGLLRDQFNKIIGVTTDRPDGDLYADVVIAADGVNSFLAKAAGMYPASSAAAHNFTLGVKETLRFDRDVIESRFGVRDDHGVDIEIIGCTGNIPGGGFVYTNESSVSVGLVLSLPALAAQKERPEQHLARLKAHSAIAPLVEGGELIEYSAHVIPESGFDMMPQITGDGMLVVGDAAAMCLAAGLWLEGVNFAMGSGSAAGLAAAEAIRRGDTSAKGLAGYEARLESNFVMKDHRRLRNAPHLVMSERIQQQYPALVCNAIERVFQVDNPEPKPRISAILRSEVKRSGIRMRDLVKDGLDAMKTFG